MKYVTLIATYALLICTYSKANAQEASSDLIEIKKNGKVFEFTSEVENDTVFVEDPITGQLSITISSIEPAPLKVNGEKIYNTDELTFRNTVDGITDIASITSVKLREYLLKGLSEELNSIPDGSYKLGIKNIAVDKSGRIIFYQFDGVYDATYRSSGFSHKNRKYIDTDINARIGERVEKLIDSTPKYKPATFKGIEVHSTIHNRAFSNIFKIQNGKIIEM